MDKRVVILIGFLLLALLLPMSLYGQGTAVPETDSPLLSEAAQQGMPTDQIIIKFTDVADVSDLLARNLDGELTELSQAAGVSLTYVREMSLSAHVIKLPEAQSIAEVAAISKRLTALPDVDYAEPDRILQPMDEPLPQPKAPELTPNDPMFGSQWDFGYTANTSEGMNLPAAWNITTGLASTVVAVIDTGILNHADLAGKTVAGYDFINDSLVANDGNGRDSDPADPGDWITPAESSSGYFAGCPVSDSSWHGSHVAGTIAAATNNSTGVAGVNWNAKILPVRVLGKCGGYTSDIIDGARWAAGLSVSGVPANANPAQVLNLSLGGPGTCGTTEQTAYTEIYNHGVTTVVAAGNDNANASGFTPASCNNVITVAANDRTGDRAYYSNYGSVVEITAPGGAQSFSNDPNGILSTLNTGTTSPSSDAYVYYQGTSMAAPHLAGLVSLILAQYPTSTPAQILQRIQDSARPFPSGSTCNTSNCGAGIADAYRALTWSMPVLDEAVYLPLVTKPISAPTLQAIDNPDNDGAYTLIWTSVSGATSYTLQEDDNVGFTSPATAYSGSSTSHGVSGKSVGTYYYRVRAVVGGQVSGWSNVRSVTVSSSSPPTTLVNGNFEQQATGWTQHSTHGWTLIVNSFAGSVTPRSGSWAAWLGGDYNEIAYVQQQVTVSASTPYLTYYHWIASSDSCGYDFGGVLVNGSIVVDVYDLCGTTSTGGWVKHSVNLHSYVGQTITFQIRAETDGSLNSNLFVDDVSFQSSAMAEVVPAGIPNPADAQPK